MPHLRCRKGVKGRERRAMRRACDGDSHNVTPQHLQHNRQVTATEWDRSTTGTTGCDEVDEAHT